MSMTIFKWTCPSCKNEEIVTRPSIFEADTNPQGARDVREERFFRVKCTSCGTEGDFLLNMLYVDHARKFLIALQPDPEMPFPPTPPGDWRALRVVRDAEDLADKVRVLESPLDDRLVAVAEYLLYRRIRPAMPAGSVLGMTSFHVGTNGPEVLLPMEIAGKGYAMGRDVLTEERLAELENLFGPALAEDKETRFRVVDRAWAAALVERCEGKND